MNKINIVCVIKKPIKQVEDLIIDYEKRLKPNIDINWIFIKPAVGKMSVESQKTYESQKIIEKLDDKYTILLDETGRQINNKELALNIEKINIEHRDFNIIIGGAYGVSEKLKNNSDQIISLSKLVLPHQLVRLFLIEQIYRSFCIINNLPYHHV